MANKKKELKLIKDSQGNKKYNYQTTQFQRIERGNLERLIGEDPNYKAPKSNVINLNLNIHHKLLPELKYYKDNYGCDLFEIRENEIYLKDVDIKYTSNQMSEFYFDYMNDDNKECFNNDALLAEKENQLQKYREKHFFNKFEETKLFETNLPKEYEVILVYVDNDRTKYPNGKLLVQVIKKLKTKEGVLEYMHKVNGKVLKQFKKLVS